MSTVTTIGFKEFIGKLEKLPGEVLTEIDGECQDAARLWVQAAQSSAPVDKGRLRANITDRKIAFLNYEVTSPILYSPYQEFGTGTKVSVPAELLQYAAQSKGKGIRQVNIDPKKFFFIQKIPVEKFLTGRITTILSRPR